MPVVIHWHYLLNRYKEKDVMNIKKIGITIIMVIMLMLGYFMLSDRELYYDGCGTGEGEIHLDASVSIAQKIVGNEKDLQKIVFYIANGDALDESTTLTAQWCQNCFNCIQEYFPIFINRHRFCLHKV